MKLDPNMIGAGPRGHLPSAPRCGQVLEGGRICRAVVPAVGLRCADHQTMVAGDLLAGPELPAGVAVPALFQDPAWQQALVGFVAEIYRDYTGLNTGADLRQILAAGAAHVRLVFGTESLDPKDIELLSRVVDRHLRALRATPKEQEAGRTGKDGKGAQGLLVAGMQVGALLERVRGALSPAQRQALAAGRPVAGGGDLAPQGPAVPADNAEAEVLEEELDLPGNAAEDPDLPPDPFA